MNIKEYEYRKKIDYQKLCNDKFCNNYQQNESHLNKINYILDFQKKKKY